ncbi:hypothetical protein NFC81_15080 [Salinispirillum sp. LH 10-3-1]|uniref:DUF2946 domain-containing protein n=1 Tax=Salinispirillum sp. LH 10-3-1 TaxID=2952525 RepID=A0AB38YFQ3_9GAMM
MFSALHLNPFRRLRCLRLMALGGLVAAGFLLAASVQHHVHYFAEVDTPQAHAHTESTTALSAVPPPCDPPGTPKAAHAVHSAETPAGDHPHAHSAPQSCPLCLTLNAWALAPASATDIPPAQQGVIGQANDPQHLSTGTPVYPHAIQPRAPPTPPSLTLA